MAFQNNDGNWGDPCEKCGAFHGKMNAGNRVAKVHVYEKDGKTKIECSRLMTIQLEMKDGFSQEDLEMEMTRLAGYVDNHFDFMVLLTKKYATAERVVKRIAEEFQKEMAQNAEV